MPRPSDNRFGGSEDLTSRNAGADRLSGRQLNLVDLAKQILQLRVGLPMDSHSGEVADITFIVGARIQGKHIALSPEQLLRWGADVARPGGDQAIVEFHSAQHLLATQRLSQVSRRGAGAVTRYDCKHSVDHFVRRLPEIIEFLRRLDRTESL